MVRDTIPPPHKVGAVLFDENEKSPSSIEGTDSLSVYTDGVKKLSFGKGNVGKVTVHNPAPVTFVKVSNRSKSVAAPLSFDNIHVPEKIERVPDVVHLPLDDDPHQVRAAIEYAEKTYQDYDKRLIPQIRQLSPLNTDVVRTWGQNALTANSELTAALTEVITAYTKADVNTIIEDTLLIVSGKQPTSLLSKITNRNRTEGLTHHKGSLQSLNRSLPDLTHTLGTFNTRAVENEERLRLNVQALSAIAAVTGDTKDDILDHAVHDRRILLDAGISQARLTRLHIEQTKQTMLKQLTTINQLLDVTIPGYELVKAGKK